MISIREEDMDKIEAGKEVRDGVNKNILIRVEQEDLIITRRVEYRKKNLKTKTVCEKWW